MPGKVIKGHAKYEENCDKCHESFKKADQTRLCLDCHKKVADDIRQKNRFHGINSDTRTAPCKQCHSEHLGRDADIVLFNKDLFNHEQTAFKLTGAHTGASCAACHKADKKYREAETKCFACHEIIDSHNKKLGEDCEKCHSTKHWKTTKFDHDKTKYPLIGKHQDVNCELCHPANKYKDTSKQCIACHRISDTHQGKYGEKCEQCHDSKRWDKSSFNHDKTVFPLRGAHIPAKCRSCHVKDLKEKLKTACFDCHEKQDKHKGDLGKKCDSCHTEKTWAKIAFEHSKYKNETCYSCHQKDDEHALRYGKKCETCHRTENWTKQIFDHKKDANYALNGKHKDVRCIFCHKGKASDEKDKTKCIQCHAIDDVHLGKQGKKCNQCHEEAGWNKNVKFDHDMSNFPLIGLHASTACSECHINSRYTDTSSACYSCHKADDTHKETLTHQCALCHNPNSWRFWQFDHDKQSKFKLTGRHKKLHCSQCHKTATDKKIEQSGSCVACHRADDEHNGRFGSQCNQCHNTESFKQVTVKQ